MNLHGVVRQAIQAVNPDTLCTWQQSVGAAVSGGNLTPAYNTVASVLVNVQGVNARDLRHIENLNLEDVYRKVYIFGNIQGVVRPNAKGGDLLIFAQDIGGTPQVWLVVAVSETWPDAVQSGWSSAMVCLQNDVAIGPVLDSNGNVIRDNNGNAVLGVTAGT